MALSVHTNHRFFLLLAGGIYLVLVAAVAIVPALQEGERYPPPDQPVDELVARGRALYLSYGCIYCHTQQIRGDERLRSPATGEVPVLAPDRRFGLDRPTTAEEYAGEDPPLFGSERIGPDLTAVGTRLPSAQWHYWHLYDPQAVSPDSIMQGLPWLFRVGRKGEEPKPGEEKVMPLAALHLQGRLFAEPDAVALVEYLLSRTRRESTR
jgi:cytochrome c oxidase cbb3-type subunit II